MSRTRPALALVALLVVAGLSGCGPSERDGGGAGSADRAATLRAEMDSTAEKTIAAVEKALGDQVPVATGRWTECNLNGTGHANYSVDGSIRAPDDDQAGQIDRLLASLRDAGIDARHDTAQRDLVEERTDYTVLVGYGSPKARFPSYDISVRSKCLDLGRDTVTKLKAEPEKSVRG